MWRNINWEEMHEEETQTSPISETMHEQVNQLVTNSQSPVSLSEKYIFEQLGSLDPKKTYQNKDEEIQVHSSGMCLDLVEKVYFNYFNHNEDDLRPLNYKNSNTYLKLGVSEELG